MNRQGSLLYKRVEFGEAFEDVWEVFFIDSFSCVGHIKTDSFSSTSYPMVMEPSEVDVGYFSGAVLNTDGIHFVPFVTSVEIHFVLM